MAALLAREGPPRRVRAERARSCAAPGSTRISIAIIGKALAADPAGRYRDASELAADLKAFKAGVRIAARHYSRPSGTGPLDLAGTGPSR